MSSHRVHWADITAKRIIGQIGDKKEYVVASGITPSGVVHFGNFREVITVDFVARALRDEGKDVRFIFSWDDYDTFRKIPKNMPKQEELAKYMFQPIVDTPDPYGEHESYAAHHESSFMGQLEKVGVFLTPLFQAKKYRAGEYNQSILLTLKESNKIKEILNKHRTKPLSDDWLPISIYCQKCNTDKMEKTLFHEKSEKLEYKCASCSFEGSEDIKTSSRLKLPWRMDWPMRWAFEKVDFEPGGKDHSSEGGSYTTAKEIVKEVYHWHPPVYLQYDFVSIKGAGGKMSSSSGDVITVNDVLNVYEPEIVRYIFAGYKSNVDFAVSFDLDVLKTYDDFDRMERLAFGVDKANDKKTNMAKRVYELSQLQGKTPQQMPIQPSFRHLSNILQIHDGDIEKAKTFYQDDIKNERDERRYFERARCARYWIEHYAPPDFKFSLHKEPQYPTLTPSQKEFMVKFSAIIESNWDNFQNDKELHEKIYEIIHEVEAVPSDIFQILYQLLIGKEKGPKLAGFLKVIGRERVLYLINGVK